MLKLSRGSNQSLFHMHWFTLRTFCSALSHPGRHKDLGLREANQGKKVATTRCRSGSHDDFGSSLHVSQLVPEQELSLLTLADG